MIDLGERLLAFEWSYLRLLEEDVGLPRMVLRTAAAVRGRRRRRPLHEAGERPDVGLGHLQRLVLGQLVVCKVGKNKCISSRHAQVTYLRWATLHTALINLPQQAEGNKQTVDWQ